MLATVNTMSSSASPRLSRTGPEGRTGVWPFLRTAVLVLVVASGAALAGCSKDSGPKRIGADCKTVEPSGGVTKVAITARNIAFDVKCLKVRPGTLVIDYRNEDSGVAHDLHVTGNGVDAKTSLKAGPADQKLIVKLTEPGNYTFACDPHGSMEGTLIVAAA